MPFSLRDFLEKKILWSSPERALSLYQKVPEGFFEGIRKSNLLRTLKLVSEKSVFYQKKFKELGIDVHKVRGMADLGSLYTNSTDLQRYPIGWFLCGRAHTAFETTGSEGSIPKRIFFSQGEMNDVGKLAACGFYQLGVRAEDVVASAFDYSFWVSGPTLKAALSFLGAFHVEAGRIDPEEFYERLEVYRPTVLVSDPSWLVRLAEISSKRERWPVKLIIAGGENLTEEARRFMEKVWGCKVILSYGQTEAFGAIGIECFEQNGYHLNEMDLWAEIVSPDSQGMGELVYTTLRRHVMPLVRYRSGDITRIMTEPCPCGLRSPRLAKLVGRADELVVTGVGNLSPWVFEKIFSNFEPKIYDWQVVLRRPSLKDELECWLEVNGDSQRVDFREKTLDRLKEFFPHYHMGFEAQVASLSVKTVSKGALRGEARKLRRIVDERRFSK